MHAVMKLVTTGDWDKLKRLSLKLNIYVVEPRAATGGHNLDLMHLTDGNIEELHYLHWMGIVALHSTAAAFFAWVMRSVMFS